MLVVDCMLDLITLPVLERQSRQYSCLERQAQRVCSIDTFFTGEHLQLMPRPLPRLLPRRRLLAIPHIPLHPLPRPPFRPQLSGQHKIRRELHHGIRRRHRIPKQELALTSLELRLEKVKVLLHVHAHPFLRLGHVAAGLEPATVQDGEAVQGVGRFGRVDPLQHGVPFWVADGWEEFVLFVVGVAEIPYPSYQLCPCRM